MRVKIEINFQACFPSETPKELSEYLSGIAKSDLLKACSFFLGFETGHSKYSYVPNFLKMFFSPENSDFVEEVFSNILEYVKEREYPLEQYDITYVISILHLFEFIFDKIPDDQITTKTTKEIEQDIFKAYVLLNQRTMTDRDAKIFSESNKETLDDRVNNLRQAENAVKISFHNYDLINPDIYKLFYCQFLRAYYYFEFLSTKDECKILLESFYDNYSVKNYKEYLKKLIGIIHRVLIRNEEAYIDILINNTEDCQFIDKHIANSNDKLTETDFINIRSTPLYKFEEGKYRIIFPPFVIEMLYNGLYFRLKSINDSLPKVDKVKNLYNLKTYEYSEQYVLSKLLKEIFGKRYIQKSGTELDQIMDGAPDYYVRNGKYIQVFESKDILISKEGKQYEDFSDLKNELSIKLFENEKGNRKAIRQLAETVRKILFNEAEYDSKIPTKNVQIFPILVVHSRIFSSPGLNRYINEWFRKELNKLNCDIPRVHDVILIDIDTLILYKDAFKNKKVSLWKLMLDYEKYYINFSPENLKTKPKSIQEFHMMCDESVDPFSLFLDRELKSIRYIPNFNEIVEKLTTLESDINE
ncbi:hypothetical protein [Kordia jejudonensis]|uniref:hypothetical protein n=1 Tax=Kordia jejudonensis TaxID=1348245 RepID=UPI00062905A1|nr:hypothetical protein [Kordia jejudonensis]